ncbi:MAG: cupredoxin family copper-binding protein [Thermomicrobiales bacterium]|nr:cupredoxin family copper-binding protein [Thermomicrobiales bacterium]
MHIRNAFSILAPFALVLAVSFAIATPGATVAHDGEHDSDHPAHIHSGTCDELGDVVFPLSNVGAAMPADDMSMDDSDDMSMSGDDDDMSMDDSDDMSMASDDDDDMSMDDSDDMSMAGEDDMSMSDDDDKVEVSVTTVSSPLSDLLSSPYAINVHKSADEIGTYIACGVIGGTMMGPSDLAIALGERNDSGASGIATLHDNGDGTTTVSVYLTKHNDDDDHRDGDSAMMGTAESDDSSASTVNAVAVSISGFAFDPVTLEVKVGDTVTWTNNDSAPHTVTQNPSGSGFQSGTLQTGESFSYTFESAGTFDYFCEFHSGMTGQVIVS